MKPVRSLITIVVAGSTLGAWPLRTAAAEERTVPAATDAATALTIQRLPDLPASPDGGIVAVDAELRFEEIDGPSWDPRSCTTEGWCADNTFFARRLMTGIWASGPEDVWASSLGGPWHFDGRSWSLVPISGLAAVHGVCDVWGAGRDDVWMTSAKGLHHWDGHSWRFHDLGRPLDGSHLWGFRSDDVWVASQAGVAHWNGVQWSEVPHPEEQRIEVIWATSPHEMWGLYHPDANAFATLEHYDGRHWGFTPGQPELDWQTYPRAVRSLWGSRADNLWLVGKHGLMKHWNGRSWRSVPSHALGDLEQVRGASPQDIWAFMSPAVSTTSDIPFGVTPGALLHWDGVRWRKEGTSWIEPDSLWRTGDGAVWVIDEAGDIEQRRDGAWSTPLEKNPVVVRFTQLWGASSDDVWATGLLKRRDGEGPAVLIHWNGARFSYALLGDVRLSQIWGSSSRDVWCGGRDNKGWNFVAHWSGLKWTVYGVPESVQAISGSGPDDVWAVGEAGMILHWTGHSWSRVALPGDVPTGPTVSNRLSGVRAFSGSDAWIVGSQSERGRTPQGQFGWRTHALMLHWDGSSWLSSDAKALSALAEGIWGPAPNDIWAWSFEFGGGPRAETVHWDGHRWGRLGAKRTDVQNVCGTAPDDLWGISDARAVHWDGSAWKEQDIDAYGAVEAIWGPDTYEVWVALESGELRRRRTAAPVR